MRFDHSPYLKVDGVIEMSPIGLQTLVLKFGFAVGAILGLKLNLSTELQS